MFSKAQPRPSRCPRCKRCRQKKIKCDYVSPHCGPCVKAKVSCEPYQQKFLFIHAESQAPSQDGIAAPKAQAKSTTMPIREQSWKVATSTAYQHPTQPMALQWQPPVTEAGELEPESELDWHVVTVPSQQNVMPTARDLVNSPMLMTGSFARASVFDQFLRYYLPDGPRLHAQSSSQLWLATARQNRQEFAPLEAAACALGVLTLGRGTRDDAMQQRSLALYGDALRFSRKHITQVQVDGENWLRVLETINLLSLFEALTPQPRPQKTLSHVAGLSALLKMAGPTAFSDPIAHNIFIHARSAVIYTAVLEEKSTFLSEPAWLEDPWIYIPKTSISICLDIVAHIPTLIGVSRAIDNAVANGEEYLHLLDAFDYTSENIRGMLDRTAVQFVRTPPEEMGGNVHEFAAVQLHHCCEIFRYEALWRLSLHALYLPIHFGKYVDEAILFQMAVEESAKTIIRDINDFNTNDCGFITANMLFLPTLAANQYLKRNNSHEEEVMSACRQTTNTFIDRGFHFFKNYA